MTTSINFYLGNHRRVFAHQHHVIKVMVGKLKTRVGKLKKLSKTVYPRWPETLPAEPS